MDNKSTGWPLIGLAVAAWILRAILDGIPVIGGLIGISFGFVAILAFVGGLFLIYKNFKNT